MPSKIIFDTLSNLNDDGKVIFSNQIYLDLSSTSYLRVPSGTGDQRPDYPHGLRWNTDSNLLEYSDSSGSWTGLPLEEDYDNLVKSGIVIHLDTYDIASYIGTGNSWLNLSKYGTVSLNALNGVFYETLENAFSFNASTHCFSVTNTFAIPSGNSPGAMINGTDSTYSFWFKANSGLNYGSGAGNKLLFGISQADGSVVLQIGINPSGGIYYNDNSVTAATVGASTNYNDDQWHYLAITRGYGTGGQTSTFYIDGSSIGTLSGTNPSYDLTDLVTIGGFRDPTSATPDIPISTYGGELSTVLIYERALSSQEVLNNYNVTSYRYV